MVAQESVGQSVLGRSVIVVQVGFAVVMGGGVTVDGGGRTVEQSRIVS